MQTLKLKLTGRKTYLLALAGVVYALLGYFLGKLTSEEASQALWAALTAAALRAGMK